MITTKGHSIRMAAAICLLAIVALGVGSAQAQGRGHGKRSGRAVDCDGGPRWERIAERLELSDEQTQAIGKIRDQNQEQQVVLRKEMMRLRNELHGEMLKDDPSGDTVQSLNEKIGEVRTELHGNRLQSRLEVRKQLTPEQRDKMLMMGEGHRGRRGRSHDGGRQGRFGDCQGAVDCPQGNR